jgi:prepilin signal peptidase PulO-like enzyme (type II secretory pathway)
MKKLFITLATVFAIFGIILVVAPTEQMAFIPVILTLISAFLALKFSDVDQKKFPKILLIIAVLTLIIIAAKQFLIKDEVAVETETEKIEKVESQKQDVKELEELEGL